MTPRHSISSHSDHINQVEARAQWLRSSAMLTSDRQHRRVHRRRQRPSRPPPPAIPSSATLVGVTKWQNGEVHLDGETNIAHQGSRVRTLRKSIAAQQASHEGEESKKPEARERTRGQGPYGSAGSAPH